ncbi:kinase-like domain-containing protein [Rhizophagus diaphanus]|nr:kinase-like domain-containing protein [Rhizophagus diaphanus] [Rhizophagus sp. MUCL 43196]
MFFSELTGTCIARCYGITKDPGSRNFMIVMGYAKDGSLRQHLNNRFNSAKWNEKLNILRAIAQGLDNIHKKGLIHRDFHCGNILKDDTVTLITDLGLCRPANVKSSQNECKELYGVLPYVAPEVLRGKGYTQESDIYSFGIIAYEVCTGLPPYHDITHDKFLAISICQGLRPKSNYKIPQLILNIIKQCWDADPLKRPKASKLNSLLDYLNDSSRFLSRRDHEINKQIEEADKINEKLTSSSLLYTGPTLSYTTNPQAVYTSRLLDFKNLPEPKNAIDNKDDDNSFGEYSESIEAIDFTKLNLDKSS